MSLQARLDHLVVIAATLQQGVAWCEATLGIVPGPGGEHPMMGTHNRIVRIATVDYPQAYLEIIAIQPGMRPQRRRWFDMDDTVLQAALETEGPRLAHFVASVSDAGSAVAELRRVGVDPGDMVEASRMSERGLLQWKISVRDDGHRLFDGCMPTLIEWQGAHPATALPDFGVRLQSISVTHPQSPELGAAWQAVGLQDVSLRTGPANLCATLLTPKGRVRLESQGI